MNFKKIFDNYFDWFLFERAEKRYFRKGIKKLCKTYSIDKLLLQMYIGIQTNLLNEINPEENHKEFKSEDENRYFSKLLLLGRIFELNLEFIRNMRKECFHSANALTRQMIEIYHISALLNSNQQYYNDFLGKSGKNLPSFREIRTALEKNNYYPKINGITKESFFESLKADYSIYSGIFHPKQDSFIYNIWTSNNDNKSNIIDTNFYKEDIKNDKPTIFLFNKKTPFHPDYLRRMIHIFYTYTEFSIEELKKIEIEIK